MVHFGAKLVLDTAIRFALMDHQMQTGKEASDQTVGRNKLNRETGLQGAHDAAWLYKWTALYGLAVQVGCLIWPGSTSGLFGRFWLYKWVVRYGLVVQVVCLLRPGCTIGLFVTTWM
jgi:hypothetical protein